MDALSGCHYRAGAKKERSMSDRFIHRFIHRSKISPKPAESRKADDFLRTDFTQTTVTGSKQLTTEAILTISCAHARVKNISFSTYWLGYIFAIEKIERT